MDSHGLTALDNCFPLDSTWICRPCITHIPDLGDRPIDPGLSGTGTGTGSVGIVLKEGYPDARWDWMRNDSE